MSNTEQQIEQEIQDKGLTAPRLTPADIDNTIVGETYTNLPDGRTVVCQLTLRNGFTVDGTSACVSKENFNQEIGNKIARENAREKIWLLEGYLLKEKLHCSFFEIPKLVPKNHIERMQSEKHELDTKLNALKAFLDKLGTDEAPLLTDDQAGYLEEQCEAMQSYSDVLGVRIEYDTEYLKAIGA
jgi:hypothetical protein